MDDQETRQYLITIIQRLDIIIQQLEQENEQQEEQEPRTKKITAKEPEN